MHRIKRSLITAAIAASLIGGLASLPAGVSASAPQNHNGANCHGWLVSDYVALSGKGLSEYEGPVKELQQDFRDACA